ncbi:protein PAT1 homolog 1-like [Limulus polyphemus]|uniref:Protein PAT1 homolog 1-like n=1 Tax=Limulus polyphemus TaxID=6850 RepID=A0ABM1BKY0_LIMPO|nr:protein PAT1 homolog 1-like [Limulus polyphemus]
MTDGFFGIDPTRLPTLGSGKLEEEPLTADVEDDYDAVNDETFGDGALEEDWEEDHKKLAALEEKHKQYTFPSFNDSELYGRYQTEDNQQEIVEQSISQLGLEDDLDDPAVITVGHHTKSDPVNISTYSRCSPPPPAIFDSEDCGSPKMHTIWSPSSTPQKNEDLAVLLKSLQKQSSKYANQNSFSGVSHLISTSFSTSSPRLLPNVRTVNEIEQDLLQELSQPTEQDLLQDSSHPAVRESMSFGAVRAEQLEKQVLGMHSSSPLTNHFISPPSQSGGHWRSPLTHKAHQDEKNYHELRRDQQWKTSSPQLPLSNKIRTLDDVEKDILLKPRAQSVQEVERHLQESSRAKRSSPVSALSGSVPVPMASHSQGFMSQPPIGTPPQGTPYHLLGSHMVNSPPVSVIPVAGRSSPVMLTTGLGKLQFSCINILSMLKFIVLFFADHIPINHLGVRTPPVFGACSPSIHPQPGLRHMLHPRQIPHPLLNNWQNRPQYPRFYNRRHEQDNRMNNSSGPSSDSYANLMTQKEKDWLIKIQMLQLHTDNPYVDDYYYTMFLLKKTLQKKHQNGGLGDEPQLIIPEKGKHEVKEYVPRQFEGSLGKLQVVSVNYPRKLLETGIHRSMEEEESSASKDLHVYRKLLLDIEKLYSLVLEIDDDDKRSDTHSKNVIEVSEVKHSRDQLTGKLFCGLMGKGSDTSANEDFLLNLSLVRKGRTLLLKSLRYFTMSQQMHVLVKLFRGLTPVLKRDLNDQLLLQHVDTVIDIIRNCTLENLVDLGQALQNLPTIEEGKPISPVKDRNHYQAAFQNKFGSILVCHMLSTAENLYSLGSEKDLEVEAQWTKVILHVVEVLCVLSDSVIVSAHVSHPKLLNHFQRFPIEREKFEALKQKLVLLTCGEQ